jgi:energy-coupling factor transporter ATP-binding protein EcfA2
VQVFLDSPDSLLAGFVSGNEPGRLIIVTGPSGSGKTRWCQALAQQANTLGMHVCGLVSPAVFKGGIKIGIDLLDLQSGARRPLAVRRGKTDGTLNTDGWQFNKESLDWGNAILTRPIACQLFILDELGPLEFNRGIGLINGFGMLARRQYHLACVVVRNSLLEAGLALWPWGEVFHIHNEYPSEPSV